MRIVVGLLLVLVMAALPAGSGVQGVAGASPAGGPDVPIVAGSESSATTERPPGTTLEADERDDGGTNAAVWFLGSGVAALVAVGVGGTILKRRAQ